MAAVGTPSKFEHELSVANGTTGVRLLEVVAVEKKVACTVYSNH